MLVRHCVWYLVSPTLFVKGLTFMPTGFKVSRSLNRQNDIIRQYQ